MASHWPLWPYDTTVEPDTTVAILLLAISTGLHGRLAEAAMIAQTGFLLILLNSIAGLSRGVTYFGGELAPMTLIALCLAAIVALTINADHRFVGVILLRSEVGVRTRVMALVGTLFP